MSGLVTRNTLSLCRIMPSFSVPFICLSVSNTDGENKDISLNSRLDLKPSLWEEILDGHVIRNGWFQA